MMKSIVLILGIIIFLWVPVAEAKDFAFPEITGWKQSGEVETFIPKNLYEYINGAADLYLMYDFEELKVAEYQNDKKASVTVDVYRHKTPLHAFGIYSQERLSGAKYLNIGVQGYYEKGFLNFLTGPYYVKISAVNTGSEDQEVLVTFAKKVAANLGPKGSFPAILSYFPAEGKKGNSEMFVSKNFLGYAFFHSGFTADYELSGKNFKLFVIERENRDECKAIIEKYLQTIKNPKKEITEGRYALSDPHHGEIDLQWRGRYLWGIIGNVEHVLKSKYIEKIGVSLEKRP